MALCLPDYLNEFTYIEWVFRYNRQRVRGKMRKFSFGLVFLVFLTISLGSVPANGLNCRTVQETQRNNDFEYVVRMCLRRMNNESSIIDYFLRNRHESSDSFKNKRERGNTNNNNYRSSYYGRNQDEDDRKGFDKNRPSSQRQNYDSREHWNHNQSRRDEDYGDETDYYDSQNTENSRRNQFKSRPHSYQQQSQHDRDSMNGQRSRDTSNYSNSNSRKTNIKSLFHQEQTNDSPLAEIELCVIHCVFQEMRMVDDNGKPNKEIIFQKMSQKIRNPELKKFIQDSVEECLESFEENDFGNRNSNNNNNHNYNNGNQRRNKNEMCEWAKTFAMCLEDKGKENCDDWNEPTQKNSNSNANNNNKNINNNNNHHQNNEDQKHKSKAQSERG